MLQIFFISHLQHIFDPVVTHCLFTVIKCQFKKQSKTWITSCLYSSCLCLNRNTGVCEWVSCFPSTGDSWCANFELSLPPQHVSFTHNKHRLWQKLLTASQIAAKLRPPLASPEAHSFWLGVCVVDVIERDQSGVLHKLLLDDRWSPSMPVVQGQLAVDQDWSKLIGYLSSLKASGLTAIKAI